MRTLVGAIAIIGAAAVALGSVAAPRELPVPVPLVASEVEATLADVYGAYLDSLSDGHPTMVKPAVAFERFVADSEWGYAMATCMNDAGFDDFWSSPDGSFGGSGLPPDASAEDEQAVTVALYACQVSFPSESMLTWGLNDEQLGYLYDYNVSWLQPCLASHGYPTSLAPSREGFVGRWLGTFWSPYDDLADLPIDDRQAARSRCAPFPASLVP